MAAHPTPGTLPGMTLLSSCTCLRPPHLVMALQPPETSDRGSLWHSSTLQRGVFSATLVAAMSRHARLLWVDVRLSYKIKLHESRDAVILCHLCTHGVCIW